MFEDKQFERAVLQKLEYITEEINKMAIDITALQAAVANETTVEQSAVTLLQQLTA